jgi:two-component system chemotaxis response regulator CheV
MEDSDILLESGTNEMELLAIEVEGQAFGINVSKVKSILQYDKELVSVLPNSPKGMVGVYLTRGTTYPLIDLAGILRKEKSSEDNSRKIVVITEFNNSINCFIVDGVRRIYRLSWDQFTPITTMFSSSSHVTGSISLEGDEILVLDLEQILSQLFPDQIIEEVSNETLEKGKALSRKRVNVLFAEDSSLIRKMVSKAFKDSGYSQLTEFENGQVAYDYIKENQDLFDAGGPPAILVTDIEMPIMDGLSLCRRVKKELGLDQIKVVIFSSLINDQMIIKCNSVGADNYVTKPESNKLIGILDDLVAGRQ